MELFSEDYLNRLIDECEINYSTDLRVLRSRTSLAIVAGQSSYTLPVGTIGIEQVTWLGQRIYNVEQADTRESASFRPPPTSGAMSATRPWRYLTVGNGLQVIQFYPVPDTAISANNAICNTLTGVQELVIVQCMRIAQVDGSEIRLPDYLLRYIIKFEAMSMAYRREGKAQNLAAAKYFKQRFEFFWPKYRKAIWDIPSAVQLELGEPTGGPRPISEGGRRFRGNLPSTGAWGW